MAQGEWHSESRGDEEAHVNEDLKEKMRKALERKNSEEHGVHESGQPKEKAHGPEVEGGASPKVHRRKAGGGGS